MLLGLTLFSLNCFARGHDMLGAVSFVLSLGFKQMALYYAPAMGSYLLGKCLYLGSTQGYVVVNPPLTPWADCPHLSQASPLRPSCPCYSRSDTYTLPPVPPSFLPPT